MLEKVNFYLNLWQCIMHISAYFAYLCAVHNLHIYARARAHNCIFPSIKGNMQQPANYATADSNYAATASLLFLNFKIGKIRGLRSGPGLKINAARREENFDMMTESEKIKAKISALKSGQERIDADLEKLLDGDTVDTARAEKLHLQKQTAIDLICVLETRLESALKTEAAAAREKALCEYEKTVKRYAAEGKAGLAAVISAIAALVATLNRVTRIREEAIAAAAAVRQEGVYSRFELAEDLDISGIIPIGIWNFDADLLNFLAEELKTRTGLLDKDVATAITQSRVVATEVKPKADDPDWLAKWSREQAKMRPWITGGAA